MYNVERDSFYGAGDVWVVCARMSINNMTDRKYSRNGITILAAADGDLMDSDFLPWQRMEWRARLPVKRADEESKS